MLKTLIFGAGWLGNKFKDYLGAELSMVDITDKKAVEEILDFVKPDVVINTAGKTGRPNIDWCEDHKLETVSSNILGPLVLLETCMKRNIFLVHLSSGCIFDGTAPHPGGFTEKDEPRPVSFYSRTKARADAVLKDFPVLILRLRMPIDKEFGSRNLITKLASYPKIIDVENSMTIVEDLLYATKSLIEKKKTGVFNVVNPGPVLHSEIMEWYKKFVNPKHKYELIKADELQTMGLAKTGRSNCILDTSKLESEGIKLPDAKTRIQEFLREHKGHL